jgi:hypothetical protein
VRPLRRPALVLAIVVAVVLPTVASGALSSPTAPQAQAANSMTYQDSSGENPAAPDITTITVSNTDAGVLSFRISVPNRPTLGQDMWFEVWINSDNNPQTGDPELAGVDYVMQLIQGEILFYRWDGTGFTRRAGDPPATSLSYAYQGGALTVRISASELGNTKGFTFLIVAIGGVVFDPVTGEPDPDSGEVDVAPGGGAGLYPYEVKITPPTLVVRSLRGTPRNPTAGRTFTLRLVAARSDTNAVVQNGRVTCVGRIGNARLRAQVQRVQGGAATCTWNIGPAAKGKTFRGSVAVAFEGLRASRSFSGKVR